MAGGCAGGEADADGKPVCAARSEPAWTFGSMPVRGAR